MEQQFYNNSIFHIEVGKIKPNPYQPRREFNESKLGELADSIRQYGVLQPIVVTRREFEKEDGGLGVEYELIAGERRLRAAKIAGLAQIPAVIRAAEDDDRMKLELAIIENLQREDLNPVDRAAAFKKLADEFGFKHVEIAKKVGKSREYVSNSIRLLALPKEILAALTEQKITEGHARPLMMLIDRPAEQMTLFKEILFKKMTVREAEGIARRIAYDKVRKHALDPEMAEMEEEFTEILGTRVRIDKKDVGGRVLIDFFSNDDLRNLLLTVKQNPVHFVKMSEIVRLNKNKSEEAALENTSDDTGQAGMENDNADVSVGADESSMSVEPDEDKTEVENNADSRTDDDGLYSVKNFSI